MPVDLGRWPGLVPIRRRRAPGPGAGIRAPGRCGDRGRSCKRASGLWVRRSGVVGLVGLGGRGAGGANCTVDRKGRRCSAGLWWDGVGSRSRSSSSPSDVLHRGSCPMFPGGDAAGSETRVCWWCPVGLRVLGVGSVSADSSSPSEVYHCGRCGGQE